GRSSSGAACEQQRRAHGPTCAGAPARAHCATTVTDPAVRPEEVAVTTIEPALPVDWTMARTLPLNAFRLVPLYDAVSMGLPLSTPTSWPGPETENATEFSPVGTTKPLPSWMSPVTNTRSRPSH